MKRLPLLAIAAVVALLLYFHRAASTTFFDGADLLRLLHFRGHTVVEYLAATVLPNPGPGFEQPFATLFFGALSKLWLGSPKPYLAALASLHLLNLILILAVSRQLNFGLLASTFTVGAFGFHAGVADIFWRPGAVSEVFAGTLVLTSLLAWLLRAPAWSALAYWLALQFNLTAVFLPVALYFLDRDRAKDLAIHAAVLLYSLLQLTLQSGLSLSPIAIWNRLAYYADELLVFTAGTPPLRILILLLGAFLPGRAIRSAYLLFAVLLLPLLLTPRPLGDESVYIPLAGAALFLGRLGVEFQFKQRMAVIAAAGWLLFNVSEYGARVDEYSRKITAARNYATRVLEYKNWPRDGRATLIDGAPEQLEVSGVRALLRLDEVTIPIEPLDSPAARQLLTEPALTVLDYSNGRSLLIFKREPGILGAPFLDMSEGITALQLGPGWLDREKGRRRILPRAEFTIHRPKWATKFTLTLTAPAPMDMAIQADGKPFGTAKVEKPGSWTYTWKNIDQLPIDTPILFLLTTPPATNPTITTLGFN